MGKNGEQSSIRHRKREFRLVNLKDGYGVWLAWWSTKMKNSSEHHTGLKRKRDFRFVKDGYEVWNGEQSCIW